MHMPRDTSPTVEWASLVYNYTTSMDTYPQFVQTYFFDYSPPPSSPGPPGDISRLIFVALLALGVGAAIGATSAMFCVRVANKRALIHRRGVPIGRVLAGGEQRAEEPKR